MANAHMTRPCGQRSRDSTMWQGKHLRSQRSQGRGRAAPRTGIEGKRTRRNHAVTQWFGSESPWWRGGNAQARCQRILSPDDSAQSSLHIATHASLTTAQLHNGTTAPRHHGTLHTASRHIAHDTRKAHILKIVTGTFRKFRVEHIHTFP